MYDPHYSLVDSCFKVGSEMVLVLKKKIFLLDYYHGKIVLEQARNNFSPEAIQKYLKTQCSGHRKPARGARRENIDPKPFQNIVFWAPKSARRARRGNSGFKTLLKHNVLDTTNGARSAVDKKVIQNHLKTQYLEIGIDWGSTVFFQIT